MSPTTVIIPFPPSAPSTPPATQFELEIQKRNTTAYIESDPTDLVLVPRERVSDGQGGWTASDPAPLPAQRMRIVTGSGVNAVERRTVDGEVVLPDIMLIAEWDAAIDAGFTYTHEGETYEVVYVNDDLLYEKLAEVVRRA